jgi:hypothetical protein
MFMLGIMSDYHDLVRDTLSFLKAEPNKELLVSQESFAFFGEAKPETPRILRETRAALPPPPQPKPVVQKPVPVTEAKAPAPSPQAEPKPIPVPQPVAVAAKPEPKQPETAAPSDDIRQMLEKAAPHVKLSTNPAHDAAAKRLATAWKFKSLAKPVTLLSFGQTGAELQFLEALVGAIDQKLMPATLVDAVLLEKEKGWEFFVQSSVLNHLITPPIPLDKFPECGAFYHTSPERIGKHILFFLAPPAEYLQNPALKVALWKTLCQHLK